MKYNKIPLVEFMKIYHKVPRAAVDVIVVSEKGFLLTKRDIPPFKGMWHMPGGSVLFKEPLKHAIGRIAMEELRIKVSLIRHFGPIEYLDDGGRHTITLVHLVKIKSGKIKGDKQSSDFKFFKKIPRNIILEQGKFLDEHLSEIKHYFTQR